MKRIFSFGLTVVLLIGVLLPVTSASAMFASSAESKTYTVLVGYENVKLGVAIEAFFPAVLTIHAGDAVHWVQNTNEIHTVTFGAPDPLPPVIRGGTPAGAPSPVMFEPQMTTRVFPAGGMSAGAYANSGLMGLESWDYHSFDLSFPQAGSYDYICWIHGMMMTGTVNVLPAGSAAPSPEQTRALGRMEIASKLALVPEVFKEANAAVLPAVKNADGTTTHNVMMGYGKGQVDLMRFFPSKLIVRPGDTVHWYFDPSEEAPHSVTVFNGAPDPALVIPFSAQGSNYLVLNPAALFPTVASGATLTRQGFTNSGIMTPNPDGFSLVIGNIQGRVPYVCLLHDESGMRGSLLVLP